LRDIAEPIAFPSGEGGLFRDCEMVDEEKKYHQKVINSLHQLQYIRQAMCENFRVSLGVAKWQIVSL